VNPETTAESRDAWPHDWIVRGYLSGLSQPRTLVRMIGAEAAELNE
jgi:hypothetical protein